MSELRRLIKRQGFWIAVLLVIISMLYPHMDTHVFWQTPLEYFASADFLYFMMMPLRFGLSQLLLPLIATLPAAVFLAEDKQYNLVSLMCYRYGKRRYCFHRMNMAGYDAAFAAVLGMMVYTLFVGVASPWHSNIISSWRNLSDSSFNLWINEYEGLPFIAFNFFCLAMTAATWGIVGFCISCFTNNTGIVIGGTFLIHYLCSWSLTYVLGYSIWSPMILQTPHTRYEGSIILIVVRLLIWFIIAYLAGILCSMRYIAKLEGGSFR